MMIRNKKGQFTHETTGENSPRWKGGKGQWGIALLCSGCGQEFRTHRSHYRESKTKIIYCSRECMKKYSKIEIACKICGKNRFYYRSDLLIKNRGQYCSKRCARADAPKMDKSAHWKGGRIINNQGYVMVYSPYHPHSGNTGYILEHRLIMEKYLGRMLDRDEVVHHINEVRTDNFISNLELTTPSKHSTHHNDIRWGNKESGKIGG